MSSLLAHYFLPHETNNFRPRTLHVSALVFYIIVFLLLQTSFRVIKYSRPDILGFATDINVERLLNLTNLQRAQIGLPPLKLNSQLSTAAQAKANDMFGKNYWAHNAPDGTTPWVFISQSGYNYLYAGENLAKDFANSEGVVNAWMASPSHRENMLKDEYQDVGFAIVNNRLAGEETTLVVEFFGTPQPVTVASKPVAVSPLAAAVTTTPSPEPSETPTPTPAALSSLNAVAGVSRRPLVNFFTASKDLASLLTMGLLAILFFDGFVIWRKKIVRISGHNLAHIIFLVGLLGALWITSQGVVL